MIGRWTLFGLADCYDLRAVFLPLDLRNTKQESSLLHHYYFGPVECGEMLVE